jgi:hypothetical protein
MTERTAQGTSISCKLPNPDGLADPLVSCFVPYNTSVEKCADISVTLPGRYSGTYFIDVIALFLTFYELLFNLSNKVVYNVIIQRITFVSFTI